jgi:hypothetical protein
MTKLELLTIVETLKEVEFILWRQKAKVFTDHKHLVQNALGLTWDHIYRQRLHLDKFGPTSKRHT